MKRNHLGEDKCVTVFSPWLHRLSALEKPPADETRRQSSEIQVLDPRSLFAFALGVCVWRRLSKILASFAFQVRRLGLSDGLSRGGALWKENKAG